MRSMLITESTVFLILNASLLITFIFSRRIITTLTLGAFQYYVVSHFILRS